jgi:hypothetical protein
MDEKTLDKLPLELLIDIACIVRIDINSLKPFSLVCRTFYNASLSFFFSHLHIKSNMTISQFARRISGDAQLAGLVKSLSLHPQEMHNGSIFLPYCDQSEDLRFWNGIPELPNCTALRVDQSGDRRSAALVDVLSLASKCPCLISLELRGSVTVPGYTYAVSLSLGLFRPITAQLLRSQTSDFRNPSQPSF